MEDEIEELESQINSLKNDVSSAKLWADFAINMLVKVIEANGDESALNEVRKEINDQYGA